MHKVRFEQPSRRDDIDDRNDYKSYKTELKEDFNCACGYCGDDCIHYEPHIDHFRPQNPKISDADTLKLFQEIKCSYENLVFSCPFCNRRKSNKWPTGCFENTCDANVGFVDPCDPAYNEQLGRHSDGRIYGKTPVGKYMFREIGLGLFRHQLLWLIKTTKHLKHRIAASDRGPAEKGIVLEELTIVLESLESMLRGEV
jgi:hypothetical protein